MKMTINQVAVVASESGPEVSPDAVHFANKYRHSHTDQWPGIKSWPTSASLRRRERRANRVEDRTAPRYEND